MKFNQRVRVMCEFYTNSIGICIGICDYKTYLVRLECLDGSYVDVGFDIKDIEII